MHGCGMYLLGSLVVNAGSMTTSYYSRIGDFHSSGQPMLPHCVYIFESSPKLAVDLGYDANSSTHVYTLDYLTLLLSPQGILRHTLVMSGL